MSTDEILTKLNKAPLDRGFYRGAKGRIYFLNNIGRIQKDGDLFLQYETKAQGVKGFTTGKAMATAVNITADNKWFNWFTEAKFLGLTPEESGLA